MSDSELTPRQLQARLAERRPMILLDVRNAADYAAGPRRIPGALKLDAELIGNWAGMLPQERDVVAYCQHGERLSKLARDALRSRGFTAHNLSGGMDAWLEADGELSEA